MRNYICVEQVDNGFTIEMNEFAADKRKKVKRVATCAETAILILSDLLREMDKEETAPNS